MIERATGWQRDPLDERDWSAAAKFGAVRKAALPRDALTLETYLRGVNDQTGSSCVGNAVSEAVDTRLRRIGHDVGKPSPQGLYALARRYQSPGVPLLDEGCFPRNAMLAIRDLGIPSANSWPDDAATIDEDPPLDALVDASKLRVFEWAKILTYGTDRADQIAQALSQDYPVVFGTNLDQAFFSYSGGEIRGYGPERKGGHMLCILGYKYNDRGERFFHVLNSWGLGWGEAGFCWVNDAFLIDDSRASDFYIIEVSA